MSRKKRPQRTVLITLIILLSVALCAALLFLWGLLKQGTPVLTVEAGSPMPPASAFFPDSKQTVLYQSGADGVDMNTPGRYPLTIANGALKHKATLEIKDTIAPTATVQDVTIYLPGTVSPEDFVTDIQDVTPVELRFEKAPEITEGTHTVVVLLEDLAGNVTRLEARLNVVTDTQAPILNGVRDIITTYVGDAVSYRSGVTVTDDCDPDAKLEVDSTGVDLSTVGEYTVIYSATDSAGNKAEKSVQVKVLEKQKNHVDPQIIYEAVDAILEKITTEDMTDRQKAEAVYVWTRLHFTYSGHTDTTDYIQSAYHFLKTKKGDCYGYFALQKLMLERMNIPTIDVRKVKNFPSDSNHYWLLVSIDGGENYYHYDNLWSKYLCLVTDKRLNSFSKQVKNCFNRDESLYPPTPTEDLPNVNQLPWNDPKLVNTKP